MISFEQGNFLVQSKKRVIVVKPATIILGLGLFFTALAPILFQKQFAQPQLAWDCVNTTTWKFEVQKPADAEIVARKDDFKPLDKVSETASYHLDTTHGLDIHVNATDGAPDRVYLRNGINFDSLKHAPGLAIQLSVKAEQAHSLFVILREANQPRWSARVDATTAWKTYTLPVSFENCDGSQAILAIHLGAARGLVSLRDIKVVTR